MWSHDYTQPGLAWREWGQSLQSWRLKYEINLRWLTPNQWKDWDISHNFIFSHEKTGTTILNWTDVFYYTKWYNRKKYLVKLNQEWSIPWSTSESSYIENSEQIKLITCSVREYQTLYIAMLRKSQCKTHRQAWPGYSHPFKCSNLTKDGTNPQLLRLLMPVNL